MPRNNGFNDVSSKGDETLSPNSKIQYLADFAERRRICSNPQGRCRSLMGEYKGVKES